MYTTPGTEIRTYDLWAAPFSLASMEVTGDPMLLVQNFSGRFSFSSDGTLVYRSEPVVRGRQQLVWMDRTGRVEGTIGEPQEQIMMPALSPDERRIAFSVGPRLTSDTWIHDMELDTTFPLTRDPETDYEPTWSPDGSQIIFTSRRQGEMGLFN